MHLSGIKKIGLLALVVSGIAIGAYYAGWLLPVQVFLKATFDPLLAKSRSISLAVGNEYVFFADRSALLSASRECFARVEDSTFDAAQLERVEQENTLLKEQLNYQETQTTTVRLAQIIAADSSSVEKTIVVNQGEAEGVIRGQPVIVGKGILVGKILRADRHTAQVRLVSDSLSRVEAAVLNTDQTIGVVEGGFGISLRMKFVPRSEVIRVNQHIITSGREPFVPRGLLIGTVSTVENEAYQGFQRVTLTPGTDLAKLSWVSVILTH